MGATTETSHTTTTTPRTKPNVQQNTSLGYTDFFFLQHADLGIGGYNVSWAAEDTSLVTADSFSISGAKGMPGTHLTCTALPDSSGGGSILAFFQTNGSDVTEYERDLTGGPVDDVGDSDSGELRALGGRELGGGKGCCRRLFRVWKL